MTGDGEYQNDKKNTIMKNVKKKYLMLMVATTLLLMAGCTADELMERPGEMPVSLTARMSADDMVATRAGVSVQGTQFDSGETFYAYFPSGVRVGNATSASSTTFTTSDSEGASTPATQPYFNVGTTTASVHAYYPYVSGKQVTNTTTSFTVEQDQSTDANYKKSDLMYASVDNLTKEGGMVTGTLTFTHKMSKIMVTANLGGGITNIQSVRLVGGSRTINISTPQSCTLGSTLSNANTTSSYVTMWSGTSTSTVDCSALLPPQTVSGNFLQIVTDMGTATYSLDSKLLESGQSYHLIITVNAAAIDMSTEIIDWGETDGVSSNLTVDPPAELTVDPISDVTYTGSALTPSLVVKYNTTTLSTSNYDVAWSNNVNVGTAQVIVVGKGATYQGKAGLATFNIVKAAGTISFSTSTKAVSDDAENFTHPLTNTGDGTVTYASSDNTVATVNATTGEVSIVGVGTTTITATVTDGSNYIYATNTASYTLTVVQMDLRNNPLWWVAQYNMATTTTMQNSFYYSKHTYSSLFGSATIDDFVYENYHVPTVGELRSIIPSSSSNNLLSGGTTTSPNVRNEVTSTVGGTDVSGSTSYWFRVNSNSNLYAVRYIGTPFASAWHYQLTTQPCTGMLIESYLVPMADETAARTVLAELMSSDVFTGAYGAETANLTPESTTLTPNAFVQRFLPANLSEAGGAAAGQYFGYSTDESNDLYYLFFSFYNNKRIFVNVTSEYLGDVRLFHDH